MNTFPLHAFPSIQTVEGQAEAREISALKRADVYARSMVISGPLRVSEAAIARLDEAVEHFAPLPDDDATGEFAAAALKGREWAYRIGLMTGLRLAEVVGPDALKAGAK